MKPMQSQHSKGRLHGTIAGLKAHLITPAPSNQIGLVDEMKPGDFTCGVFSAARLN